MPTRGYLNKQAALLLKNPIYAWCMTGVLALFPFSGWLSLAIMALVTLRRHWFDGVRCLIVGLTASICWAEVVGQVPETLDTVVPAYLLCYGLAFLLRRTASWQLVAIGCVSIAMLAIFFAHWFAANFIMEQYQTVLKIINAIDQDNLMGQVFGNQNGVMQLKFAHYFLGIKVISVILSAMVPLMLARSIQSALYYPGAFKQEMMSFRANSLGCVLLLLTMLGVYQNNLLSISCLPIFFVYLMMAGVSLIFNLLVKKKKLVIYAALFLPVVILPYIVLPAYVLFGSIDSVFNLRSRWCLHTQGD
ncbi:MAG: hypothetical protein A3F46_05485 [Legionellales bacterium RIFCSPHIGHO2_12_FULL_42_9]|nr:MAG: hypothetical protein A3F46_05485 [Legionellales bacterium RIFCSPHIGHO2_12_FULL_42_9]